MREIGNIQVLRGVAALSVVMFHAQQELTFRHLPLPLPDLFVGAAGVDVFFAVSGFIILYASAPLFGRTTAVVSFARRRAARIVPLYWLALAICATYTVAYDLPPHDRHAIERSLATSMLFFPAHGNAPLLTTGWTLNFEMLFYTLFAFALPFGRRRAVAVLSAVLVAYGLAGVFDCLPEWGSALSGSILFEFVMGLWMAEARLSGVRLPGWGAVVLAGGGALGLAATVPFDPDSWWLWRGIVWGVPAAALVAGAVLAAPEGRGGPVRRAFERLGDTSYALYIMHYTLLAVLSRMVLPGFPPGRFGAMAFFVLLVSAAIAAGWLTHVAVERPLYRWMTGRRLRPVPMIPVRHAT